ncbi:hypothetical protein LPMP_204940 [Leishmania panamensis]|uniref:Uncharacterized protein n=1 Tax=Leishmania panamensis TaxID=5679 RepID=A0A088S8N8_LEIPA|nr:hypothetical protein LPMP_204940 [Leishmania panamensis]AIN97986.1 hypothetical protein LPMP_204940 [Leishmania panamensis]
MGAVPSRECTSLFSYFRGSYEVGMVPLTKYYFGKDTDTSPDPVDIDGSAQIAPLQRATTASRKPQPQLPSLPLHVGSRSHIRQQLRQQLLLMRRDPAVLYANARDAENILQGLSRQGKSSNHDKSNSGSKAHTTSEETTNGSPVTPVAKATSSSAATVVQTDVDHNAHKNNCAATQEESSRTGASSSERSDSSLRLPEQDGIGAVHSCAEQLLFSEYWSIMPDSNFTEADLDRFLDLVDATLFDTNNELLSADPVLPGTAAATDASSTKPFIPVPCALCLAYPEGKEREGALALEGRVINIIGYFGLMTREMQDAFKVVKRLPSEAEKQQQEQQAQEGSSTSEPLLFLNTAILTSAGNRTLERVLVLAAVMLRQQFHTIGRRHVLQTKLDQLLYEQREQKLRVDPHMVHYLQTLLTLPPRAENQPFFDPLLEIPLPSIPSGIYTPTHYVNAAYNEASQHLHASSLSSCGRTALASFPGEGKFQNAAMGPCADVSSGSSPNMRSLPHDQSASMGGALSAPGASREHMLLYPQQNVSGVLGIALNVPGPGSEGACALLMDGCGGSLGTNNAPTPTPPALGPLPLSQSDEDVITLALCRRIGRRRVVIETASNNYSALKSLTENFAFLCCQILLDQSLTTMELIELPALVETPFFKPSESATTVTTTISSTVADETRTSTAVPQPAADGETKPLNMERLSQPRFPPSSAVLIKLDPLHVCQATMWASSFFHCPTLLPSGGWVKYKLKDECEQLRHVLQNKDMLIAHWRKTDVDQAAHYLGKHTPRLLEHVRALQAETEEARALSAEHWMQQPLYVNQDGRKYGLYQSRYGTMLIGVRAFKAGNGPSTMAAVSTKEKRSGSTKATAESNMPTFLGDNTSLAAHAGWANTDSASLHNLDSGNGNGFAIAPHGAVPRSGGVNGCHTSRHSALSPSNDESMNLLNVSSNGHLKDRYSRGVGGSVGSGCCGGAGYSSNGPYTNYLPHAASGGNGNGAYAPVPFLQPQVYMSKNTGGHNVPPYMMVGTGGRPGEVVSYSASPPMSGYPMEMVSGYNMPPSQQHQRVNMINTIPNLSASRPDHNSSHSCLGSSPAHGMIGWPALQPSNAQIPPPPAPSHMSGTSQGPQQQQEVIGSLSGFAYASASSPMAYNPVPPTCQAASHNTNPAVAGTFAPASSTHSPRISSEQVKSSPLRADVATTSQSLLQSVSNNGAQLGLTTDAAKNAAVIGSLVDAKTPWVNKNSEAAKSVPSSTPQGMSTSALPAAAAPFSHGCVGMNRNRVGAAGDRLAASPRNGSAMQQAARSGSDPHATKAADESETADEATTPKTAMLRSVIPWSLQGAAEWVSSDDATDNATQFLLRSTELLDTDDDDAKKASVGGNSDYALSRGTTGKEELGASHVTQLIAYRDMFVADPANQLLQSAPSKNADMSIVNMLLAAPQQSDAAMTSVVSTGQLALPTTTELPKPAPMLPAQPGGVFPMYVLQLPTHTPQQQQQQPQSQPQLPTTSPPQAAALSPDNPLYYTMANGVPLLLQPAAVSGGIAIAYPNGQPFPHGGDGVIPYPTLCQPSPPQQPMQQQQSIPMIPHSQAMMNTPGLGGIPVAQFSAQAGTSWGNQYHFLSNSPGSLPGSFASGFTPVYNSSNLFQPDNTFSQ